MEQNVISIFKEHRWRYGVRRVAAELKARAAKGSAYKVRKVLKKHSLKAIQSRSFVPQTTGSRHPYPVNANLLAERSFRLRPDEVWVGHHLHCPLRRQLSIPGCINKGDTTS